MYKNIFNWLLSIFANKLIKKEFQFKNHCDSKIPPQAKWSTPKIKETKRVFSTEINFNFCLPGVIKGAIFAMTWFPTVKRFLF